MSYKCTKNDCQMRGSERISKSSLRCSHCEHGRTDASKYIVAVQESYPSSSYSSRRDDDSSSYSSSSSWSSGSSDSGSSWSGGGGDSGGGGSSGSFWD